jgi:hypothetical protein
VRKASTLAHDAISKFRYSNLRLSRPLTSVYGAQRNKSRNQSGNGRVSPGSVRNRQTTRTSSIPIPEVRRR